MKSKKARTTQRKLIGILLTAMVLSVVVFGTAIPAYAADYADVTVTATPSYISIANSQATWTINGITGDGVIDPSTTYYSNPNGDTTALTATVAVGEGYFSVNNTSTVNIDIAVDMEDFSGGNANMTNGETGSAGSSSYGAYSYYEGCTYANDKQIVKKHATGSTTLWTSSSPGDDLVIGVVIATQTGAWSGGSSSTATLKITATKH